MASRVFCAVFLCLLGSLISAEAVRELNLPRDPAVNPGVCPSKYYTAEECKLIRFVSCADDSECAKNEKCCHNGCGLQCRPTTVAAVNPGVCPSKYYTAEECKQIRFVSCADDSECAKNEKCCHNGCGLQCMAPVTVKPGMCPSKRYTAKQCDRIRYVMAPKQCGDDSKCPNNEKCCSNGCIRQCAAPVTAVNPGVCPRKYYTAEECKLIRFVSCADDSECAKNEKCCHNGCGLQCMAPATVKPGQCPSGKIEASVCAVMRFMWSCDHDSDCAKNEKCCHNGCVLQCMAPLKVPFLDSEMASFLPEMNLP